MIASGYEFIFFLFDGMEGVGCSLGVGEPIKIERPTPYRYKLVFW